MALNKCQYFLAPKLLILVKSKSFGIIFIIKHFQQFLKQTFYLYPFYLHIVSCNYKNLKKIKKP